jgi:hypothetical protein
MKRHSWPPSSVAEFSVFSVPIQNIILSIAYFKHLAKLPGMGIGSSQGNTTEVCGHASETRAECELTISVSERSKATCSLRSPYMLVTYDGIKSRLNSWNASHEGSRIGCPIRHVTVNGIPVTSIKCLHELYFCSVEEWILLVAKIVVLELCDTQFSSGSFVNPSLLENPNIKVGI